VLAFVLAIAAEIVVGGLVDVGAPALAFLGAGVCALIVVRRLRLGPRRTVDT